MAHAAESLSARVSVDLVHHVRVVVQLLEFFEFHAVLMAQAERVHVAVPVQASLRRAHHERVEGAASHLRRLLRHVEPQELLLRAVAHEVAVEAVHTDEPRAASAQHLEVVLPARHLLDARAR